MAWSSKLKIPLLGLSGAAGFAGGGAKLVLPGGGAAGAETDPARSEINFEVDSGCDGGTAKGLVIRGAAAGAACGAGAGGAAPQPEELAGLACGLEEGQAAALVLVLPAGCALAAWEAANPAAQLGNSVDCVLAGWGGAGTGSGAGAATGIGAGLGPRSSASNPHRSASGILPLLMTGAGATGAGAAAGGVQLTA